MSRVDPDGPPLPDPSGLSADQRRGLTCARCARPMLRSRRIGTVTAGDGRPVELWVCLLCATPAERAADGGGAGPPRRQCMVCEEWGDSLFPVGVMAAATGPGHMAYAHDLCLPQLGESRADDVGRTTSPGI